MRSSLRPVFVACVIGLLLASMGCNNDNAAPSDDSSADTDGSSGSDSDGESGTPAAPDGARVTYANFGDAYLRNWCRGCHSSAIEGEDRSGAPDGIDFNTHEDAQMWADRIRARALGDDPGMPPAGGPSAEELALLEEWLDAGVP
jgi:uncharacterized membrane protein